MMKFEMQVLCHYMVFDAEKRIAKTGPELGIF